MNTENRSERAKTVFQVKVGKFNLDTGKDTHSHVQLYYGFMLLEVSYGTWLLVTEKIGPVIKNLTFFPHLYKCQSSP